MTMVLPPSTDQATRAWWPARLSAYPRGFGTMILPAGMGAWGEPGGGGVAYRGPHIFSRRRGRGLGQLSLWDSVVNAAENVASGLPVDTPPAGGGWVSTGTNADGSTNINMVDTSGNAVATTVPPGVNPQDYVNQQRTPAFTFSTIPTWAWWAIGGVGVLLLLGYSGAGRVVFRGNPLLSVFGNPPHRRRHRNRRRNRSHHRSRR